MDTIYLYTLTPPAVSPSINCRCRLRKIVNSGAITMTADALVRPQSLVKRIGISSTQALSHNTLANWNPALAPNQPVSWRQRLYLAVDSAPVAQSVASQSVRAVKQPAPAPRSGLQRQILFSLRSTGR